jgi:EmrB/QacA subfamily drug resistance transporter
MTTLTTARPALRHERATDRPLRTTAVLVVLLTAQLMAVLDVNIVNVAGATIRSSLHTSGAGLQLVIAGYTIAYAVALITGARIGGIVGPRRVFLGGLVTFTAASLACGLAGDSAMLIAFRVVQGAGAAFMIPQVFSLIQRHFAGPARVRALGRYAAVIALGVVAGQVLGGVLVDANLWGTGWRPIFWINVPIGIGLLFAGSRLLPADTDRDRRPLDIGGLITLMATVLALVVPLVFGHEEGWPIWCWLSLAASAVLFTAFAAVQRRATAPLIPARVVRARGMLAALGAMFLMMTAYSGYLFAIALHLQTALHYSPLRAGLTFVPMALTFAVASLNWRRLPVRWHASMSAVGLVIAALSIGLIAFALHRDPTPGALFFAAQIPMGIGSGIAYSPLVTRALAAVAPADAADASGLVTTSVQLAQVVGLAVIGSLYLALSVSHGFDDAAPVTLAVDGAVTLVAAISALLVPRVGRPAAT